MSRRERPPSGRSNVHTHSNRDSDRERPRSALPPRPQTAQQTLTSAAPSPSPSFSARRASRPQSSGQSLSQSQSQSRSGALNALVSTRSQESELSTGEVLRRMREKSDARKNEIDEREIEALGDYNAFSRPKNSQIAPLRTVFLDPSVNNFPRSKTRTELLKRIKVNCIPHPSYDLDNDGYVSQHDYFLAKRFDFDGNGLLDPDERNVGKHILAEEFFKKHEKDISNYGPSFAVNTRKQNVEKLVNSYSFERTYGKLLSVERTLTAESSKPLLDCIRNDEDPQFQKNKYATNKLDATAWNDFDRLPRSSWMGESLTEDDHKGSRRRLLFARREQNRREGEQNLTKSLINNETGGSTINQRHGRIKLISDIKKREIAKHRV